MVELRHLLVDARPVNHPTARNRGIGRYTIGLLSGLVEVGAPVVALYESDEEAELLLAAIPQLSLRRWGPAAVREFTTSGTWYLATQLMLHPIPLDPIPRIITESGLPVAAVMYDVIPERYPLLYQSRPTARAQVQLRGMLARTVDVLLAISEFAADTAADELNFPRSRIATIGAGVERQFAPAAPAPWSALGAVLPDDRRPFVLMVAGTDSRKNTERMIAAWGEVDAAARRDSHLVVVGAVDELLLRQWHQWARDAHVAHSVTFTGGVSDDVLVALHQTATLAVMPSTEEGFGLPVLEAAACGCPVLTSNVSSLPEVLSEPAAEFDPYDTLSIARAVQRALTDDGHREVLLAAGRRAVDRWTWAHTGRAVVESVSNLGPRQQRVLRPLPPRIALMGRFDGSDSGLANAALLGALRESPTAPEIHLLVDNDGSVEPIGATALRFPARALGRSVHRSLFDDIVSLQTNADGDRVARSAARGVLGLPSDSRDGASTLLDWLGSADQTA